MKYPRTGDDSRCRNLGSSKGMDRSSLQQSANEKLSVGLMTVQIRRVVVILLVRCDKENKCLWSAEEDDCLLISLAYDYIRDLLLVKELISYFREKYKNEMEIFWTSSFSFKRQKGPFIRESNWK